jgi:hypothetical protein
MLVPSMLKAVYDITHVVVVGVLRRRTKALMDTVRETRRTDRTGRKKVYKFTCICEVNHNQQATYPSSSSHCLMDPSLANSKPPNLPMFTKMYVSV